MSSTFAEQELAGWTAKAGNYDAYVGLVTRRLVPALLDAAAVRAGSRVLDVACGTGYAAGGAAERGADVVGIDFAPTMLAEASRSFGRVDFRRRAGCFAPAPPIAGLWHACGALRPRCPD